MKFTFLGTGGAFSKISTNFHNNVLVEINGYRLLIDCGFTALESLSRLEPVRQPHDVDGVLITHIHADHVGGLEELAFRGYFLANKKFDLFTAPELLPARTFADSDGTDLWENCLKGGLKHIQTEEGEPFSADLDTYFDVHVNRVHDIQGCSFRMFSTDHVPAKYSFGIMIVTDNGNNVLFTADSKVLTQKHYDWADVIFHDCALYPKYPSTVHAHFEELEELDAETRSKIRLMHYGDANSKPDDLCGMELVEFHHPYSL